MATLGAFPLVALLLPLTLFGTLSGCASAKGGGDNPGPGGDDAGDLLMSMNPDMAGGGGQPDLFMPAGNDLRQGGGNPDLSTPMPDLATPPADMKAITGCTIIPQSGCPAGQKCTTHDGATTICDPNGTVDRGGDCSVNDCLAGTLCINETAADQCRGFCNTNTQCLAINPKSYCDHTLTGAAMYGLCTQPCNPIYPGSGCIAGLACKLYGVGDGHEHPDCQGPGAGDLGQPCKDRWDCKSGLICIASMAGTNICYKVCPKGNSAFCGGGYNCNNINDGGTLWPTYGVCCPGGSC